MPVIRANRDAVDDRFSVLGLTVTTEHPLVEIGFATKPEYFRAENQSLRTYRNFFSSRGGGMIRARRGEAVYLLPPEIMSNFLGQEKLYFGVATYSDDSRGKPVFVQSPTLGSMYVNIAGLTERGLRRLMTRALANPAPGAESLVWGGDFVAPAAQSSASAPAPAAAPPVPPAGAQAAALGDYDDGWGNFPEPRDDSPHGKQLQISHGGLPSPTPATRAMDIPLAPETGGMSISAEVLAPGDIIVSTARHPISYLIRAGTLSAVSHAMIYVGNGNVVEAVGEGVREIALMDAIRDAILAVAYRDNRVDAVKGALLVQFARQAVAAQTPYDVAGVARQGYRILHPIQGRLIDLIRERLRVDRDAASSFYCSDLVLAAYQAAGIPLTAEDPDVSTPGSIVRLVGGVLSYLGHLKAADDFLGLALGLPLRQSELPGALATTAPARGGFSINWDSVQLVPQPTDVSCWAAAAAMVVGWRDNLSIDAKGVADIAARSTAAGLDPQQVGRFATEMGLFYHPPQSITVERFRTLLADNGPLWVGAAVPELHAIVVTGIYSDGAEDGSGTFLRVADPWDRVIGSPGSPGSYLDTHDTGSRYILSWKDFLKEYEGACSGYPEVGLQILHAGGTFGHHPNPGLRPEGYQMALQEGGEPAAPSGSGGEEGGGADAELLVLEPPPPPRARSLAGGGVGAGAAAEAIGSIAGKLIERLLSQEGHITWSLDQWRGIKHPGDKAPEPVPPFRDAQVIRVGGFKVKNLLGDELSAAFDVQWQYNGSSLGNISITNVGTNYALLHYLNVEARLMDDNVLYPSQADPDVQVAALRVRFRYAFSRPPLPQSIGVYELHLFGDGTWDGQGQWEQTQAY